MQKVQTRLLSMLHSLAKEVEGRCSAFCLVSSCRALWELLQSRPAVSEHVFASLALQPMKKQCSHGFCRVG